MVLRAGLLQARVPARRNLCAFQERPGPGRGRHTGPRLRGVAHEQGDADQCELRAQERSMDLRVDPAFQQQLDWMNRFVREEVEPLDLLFPSSGAPYDTKNTQARALVKPLQAQVKERGLWACHLPPELGGKGYGQLKLA